MELDLVPLIEEVLQDILSGAPGFFGDLNLPDLDGTATERKVRSVLERTFGIQLSEDFGQVTVFDEDRLSEAQDAVALLNRFVPAVAVLALLSGAAALALSVGRRRTLLQLALGVAIGTTLVFTVLRRVIGDLVDLVPEGENRDAARAAARVVSSDLHDRAWYVLVTALVIAVVASLVGPGRGAVWV